MFEVHKKIHKQYLKNEFGEIRRGKPTTFYDKVYTQNGTKEIDELFPTKTQSEFSN